MNSASNENISTWSRERICEFLQANGCDEDLAVQDLEDLVGMATTIQSTMTSNEESVPELQETDPIDLSSMETNELFIAPAAVVVAAPPEQTQSHESDEDEKFHLTLAMCEATGIEFEDAQKALQEVNWNLSTAVAAHYNQSDIAQQHALEEQQLADRRSRSSSTMARSRSSSSLGDDSMMSITGTGIADDQHHKQHQNAYSSFLHHQIHSHYQHRHDDEGDDDYDDDGILTSSRQVDQYDEDGIRRPDPVRNQRLISGPHPRMMIDNSTARADDPSVEWMYEPPNHLSFPGSFQEVKAMCKDEKKWLVVNIQSHHEFSSHMLNRETWSDETIESILRSSFLFWQRGHTSGEGQGFIRTYQLTDSDLPNISIIDCRTGARILTIKGFISPEELSVLLMEFLDANPVDGTDAPVVRHIDTTKWKNHDNDAVSPNYSPTPIDESDAPIDYDVDDGSSPYEDQDDDDVHHILNESSNISLPIAINDISLHDHPVLSSTIAKAMNYGISPSEPEGYEDSIKVSIKLASGGKPLVRRFYRHNTVRQLYAVVDDIEGHHRPFDLLSSFPTTSLADKLDLSLEAASLAGSQILMRWL